jgi:hypothetical protein
VIRVLDVMENGPPHAKQLREKWEKEGKGKPPSREEREEMKRKNKERKERLSKAN